MNWIARLLRPAPHIPRTTPEQAQRLYPKMRWQILESTFIGYATFYFVRNNLPVVSREMGQALHYSMEQVGNILAATAISYGVGKLFMGAWSDRSNPRYFMPLGLVLTAICNFAFGAVSSYHVQLALWALNGLVQSMGWAPCGRSLGHWYSVNERGTMFAFWNVAQNVGGGLTGLLVAYSTVLFGWRSAFYVPGVLAILCAVYLLIRLRDTPQSMGLPPIEEWRNDYPAGTRKDGEQELGTRDLLINYIFKNGYLWLFAFANFFVYIARYAMLDWGPTYLKEVKHASIGQGGMSTAALEFSAIFSTILMGWLSDKLGGRRGMISVLCMIPVLAVLPGNHLWSAGQTLDQPRPLRRDWILCLSRGAVTRRERARLHVEKSRGHGRRISRPVWLSRPHRRGRGHRRACPALRLERGAPRSCRCSGFGNCTADVYMEALATARAARRHGSRQG